MDNKKLDKLGGSLMKAGINITACSTMFFVGLCMLLCLVSLLIGE